MKPVVICVHNRASLPSRINTIGRFENGTDTRRSTLIKLQHAPEAAGMIFIDGNGEGPAFGLRGNPEFLAD